MKRSTKIAIVIAACLAIYYTKVRSTEQVGNSATNAGNTNSNSTGYPTAQRQNELRSIASTAWSTLKKHTIPELGLIQPVLGVTKLEWQYFLKVYKEKEIKGFWYDLDKCLKSSWKENNTGKYAWKCEIEKRRNW